LLLSYAYAYACSNHFTELCIKIYSQILSPMYINSFNKSFPSIFFLYFYQIPWRKYLITKPNHIGLQYKILPWPTQSLRLWFLMSKIPSHYLLILFMKYLFLFFKNIFKKFNFFIFICFKLIFLDIFISIWWDDVNNNFLKIKKII